MSYDISIFPYLLGELRQSWEQDPDRGEVEFRDYLLERKTIKKVLGEKKWQLFKDKLNESRWLDEISEFVWWMGLEFEALGLKVRVTKATTMMRILSTGQPPLDLS